MKKCKSCQKEIDNKAKKCPYCQSDQRNWFIRHPILSGILILFIIGIVAASSGSNSSKSESSPTTGNGAITPKPETPISVNLKTFLAEFDNNQLAAEEKWSEKLIEFTGTISNISGSSNNPYVSFSESNDFLKATATCRTLKDSAQAVTLKNGQSVTVEGRVDNQSLGIVDIKNCVFK